MFHDFFEKSICFIRPISPGVVYMTDEMIFSFSPFFSRLLLFLFLYLFETKFSKEECLYKEKEKSIPKSRGQAENNKPYGIVRRE